eukprot:5863437-Amphidinium_carterae.1
MSSYLAQMQKESTRAGFTPEQAAIRRRLYGPLLADWVAVKGNVCACHCNEYLKIRVSHSNMVDALAVGTKLHAMASDGSYYPAEVEQAASHLLNLVHDAKKDVVRRWLP